MKKGVPVVFLFLIVTGVFSVHGQQSDFSPITKRRVPVFSERQEERELMVEQQIARRGVLDEGVLRAMRAVPRHLFIPDQFSLEAYEDHPLPIGYGQTISQPYVVAYMTELLELEAGDRVLEIGTGSGYQAAVLAEITPEVYTVEIIEPLGEQAKLRFEELDYEFVSVKVDDGYYGWEEYAPFDAIIVTAAAGHIPPPLVKQLKPGGRIVIPLGQPYSIQILMLVLKGRDDTVTTRQLMPVRFVPMTGKVGTTGG